MKCNEMTLQSKLSKRQLQVLPYILSSPTYEDAARKANISPKQIHEWLKNPEFKTELEMQRNQVVEAAINRLKMNTDKAVEALSALLSSSNEMVRRGAANDILNHVIKFQELKELEERVVILEKTAKRTP